MAAEAGEEFEEEFGWKFKNCMIYIRLGCGSKRRGKESESRWSGFVEPLLRVTGRLSSFGGHRCRGLCGGGLETSVGNGGPPRAGVGSSG